MDKNIFWLKYRKTLGNDDWVTSHIIIPLYCLVILFDLILLLTNKDIERFIMNIIHFSNLTIGIIVYFLIPNALWDHLNIRKEIKYAVIFSGIAILMSAIFAVMLEFNVASYVTLRLVGYIIRVEWRI